MSKIIAAAALIGLMVFSFLSCSTVTIIKTVPEGADIYIQGDLMGKTPWKLDDNYSLPEEVTLRFEKEGYIPLKVRLEKEMSYPVGIASYLPYPPFPISFFWAWKYGKSYNFKLTPKKDSP